MTLKEYLSQAFEVDKKMKTKARQIQKFRDMQMNISSKLVQDKVQTGSTPDKFSKLSDNIMDLENNYIDDMNKLIETQRKIKKVVDGVQNITYHLILEERYVNLKDWGEVADDNGYSERRVYELHGEALQELTSQILQNYFASA